MPPGSGRGPGGEAVRADERAQEGTGASENPAATSRCTRQYDGRIPCSLPDRAADFHRRPQDICVASAWHAFRPGAAIPGGKQKAGLPAHICTCIRIGACMCGRVADAGTVRGQRFATNT